MDSPKRDRERLATLTSYVETNRSHVIFIYDSPFKEYAMTQIRQFELLEDLSPEGEAEAVLLKWNGNKYVRSNETVVICDVVRMHGDRGDRGYAFKSSESGNWEVLGGLYQQVSGFGGM